MRKLSLIGLLATVVMWVVIVGFSSAALSDQTKLVSAENEVCICQCAYPKQSRIKVPGYFQASKSSSCSDIEGLACLATHRGTSFTGVTTSCQNGALPVDLKNPIGANSTRFPING